MQPMIQGFPDDSVVKNLLAKQEMWVLFLGREDPMEKEMATNSSSCLGNLMDRGAWRATVQATVHD